MNSEIKQMWIQELRSDDYNKAENVLHADTCPYFVEHNYTEKDGNDDTVRLQQIIKIIQKHF